MEIKRTSHKRSDVVSTSGRIDSSNADELFDFFKAINEEDRFNIIFDMSEVNFMSSKGWWVLIETQKACKAKSGEVVLLDVQEKIVESLNLVGMTDYFKTFSDLTEAVGSF